MARKKKTKWHGGRALLNDPGHHGLAAVIAEIVDSESEYPDGDTPRWYTPAYTFQIADCDRHIALEIDLETTEDRRNTLKKLDRLISTLEKFREGVRVEADRAARREGRVGVAEEAKHDAA